MTNYLTANMLTNIRNANKVLKNIAFCKYNLINISLLTILVDEGYILRFEVDNNNKIKILLKYKGWFNKKPMFSIIKMISKSGNRVFCKYKQLKNNNNILNYSKGIAILSTSSGLLTHHKAIYLKKGGELICYIE